MATGVGVVVVRAGMAIGIVVSGTRRLVIMMVVMVVPAAFGCVVVAVGMIQREHTAE